MKKLSIEKLDKVFDNLEAGLILVDSEHKIRWMNEKASEWFGPINIDEKRKCYRIKKHNENFCRICPTRRAISFGMPMRYEMTFPINGTNCNFEIIGLPVKNGNERIPMVMEVILNKSKGQFKKKGTKDIFAQMEKMAAIGDLAAGIAHELNTPLTTISIITQELKDITKTMKISSPLSKEIEEYLADLDTEVKRCSSIVGDVQNFAGKGIHKKKSVNLTDLINKTVDFISKTGLPKSVVIKRDLGIFPQINADPDRLRQVLLNILKNAIEALSSSEGKKEITLSIKREKQYILIIIHDNGIGIPKKNFKKLFEPFYTTKAAGKGTGLGLFVSYGIMKDLGGDISIESSKAKGTTVTLSLPLE